MSGSLLGETKSKGPSMKKKGPDLSTLQPPISTTVTGMKQAIHVLETGSRDAKEAMLNESNLIYECKVCLSLFRSIANLVTHKRSYCTVKSESALHVHRDDSQSESATTVIVEPELPEHLPSSWNMENTSPSMELLQTAGVLEDILGSKNTINPNKSLLAISKQLRWMAHERSLNVDFRSSLEENQSISQTLVLEPVHNTNNAQYQSWRVSEEELTVRELNEGISASEFERNNLNIVVKPIPDIDTSITNTSIDSSCNVRQKRYPCVKCKLHFTTMSSVKRHLMKRHKFDMEMFGQARPKIEQKTFYIDVPEISTKPNLPVTTATKPTVPVSTPIKPVVVNISKSVVTPQHLERLYESRSDEVYEPLERVPAYVEEKIMEHVNRRHVQCKTCCKKFRSTDLAKQHVAGVHLHLERYKCTLCDFGAWVRDHVVKHAEKSHRKCNKDSIKEQKAAEYFVFRSEVPEKKKKQSPLKNVCVGMSPVKLLQNNLINLDRKEKSPSTFSEKENEPELPSVQKTIDQIRLSVEEREDLCNYALKESGKVSKRRRLNSEESCSSSQSNDIQIESCKNSPRLLFDTRDTNPRLLSPPRSQDERRPARASRTRAKLIHEGKNMSKKNIS